MDAEMQSKDYQTLLNEDIPNGLDDLIITSKLLEDGAQHFLVSYDRSLEQTVNYTAQALGSVAYKINLIANNFLAALDQQNVKLNGLQSKVNHLNMQVKIHNENSARLSIGKLTSPKNLSVIEVPKTVNPILEINETYRRRGIDFTLLDNIGHGVNDAQLSGSVAAYGSPSRHSSVSGVGSDCFVYNSKHGSESSSKYGKVQTAGKASNVGTNFDVCNILRSSGPGIQRSQIPTSPTSPLTANNTVSPPPVSNYGLGTQNQSPLHGVHRYNSINTTNSGPSKLLNRPMAANLDTSHAMADIPPPPLPNNFNQVQKSLPSPIGYSHLPPPPMTPPSSAYQSTMLPLPPPPLSNVVQRNSNASMDEQDNLQKLFKSVTVSDSSVPIQSLQSNPNDSIKYKAPNAPAWVPSQYLCKVRSLYEYQRNNDDELGFKEQEIIYVVTKNSDGWWMGVMSNGTGLFPGNYVQLID